MPKVFHGISIPDEVAEEITCKHGLDWTVGHIMAWLLEKELERYCEKVGIPYGDEKVIETPKLCYMIKYAPAGKYVCQDDQKLSLADASNPGVFRFQTEGQALEFAESNNIPINENQYGIEQAGY